MNISKHFECAPFKIKLLGKEIQVMPKGIETAKKNDYQLHHFFNCRITAIGNINYDLGAFGRIDKITLDFDFYSGYACILEMDLSFLTTQMKGKDLDRFVLSRFFSREITDEIIKRINNENL